MTVHKVGGVFVTVHFITLGITPPVTGSLPWVTSGEFVVLLGWTRLDVRLDIIWGFEISSDAQTKPEKADN